MRCTTRGTRPEKEEEKEEPDPSRISNVSRFHEYVALDDQKTARFVNAKVLRISSTPSHSAYLKCF